MSDEQEVTPALFEHAKRVYDEMLKRSRKETFEDEAEGGTPYLVDVYEGHLTHLFSDLQIANPYYTKIRNVLVAQNCIAQLRRGGGSAMSKWVLHNSPTEETFKELAERKRASHGRLGILEQQVKDMRSMLTGLASQVEELHDYVQQGRTL